MKTIWYPGGVLALAGVALFVPPAEAQNPPQSPSEQTPPAISNVRTVDVSPGTATVSVDQELTFTALGKDASGSTCERETADDLVCFASRSCGR